MLLNVIGSVCQTIKPIALAMQQSDLNLWVVVSFQLMAEFNLKSNFYLVTGLIGDCCIRLLYIYKTKLRKLKHILRHWGAACWLCTIVYWGYTRILESRVNDIEHSSYRLTNHALPANIIVAPSLSVSQERHVHVCHKDTSNGRKSKASAAALISSIYLHVLVMYGMSKCGASMTYTLHMR